MHWKLVIVILCLYGFIKEFRPLEPFLTPFLQSDIKNFTDVQLYSQIYPFWTYSYLIALVPIFLLTDLLRYNVILLLGALSFAATWFLLIYGSTVSHMILMQFFFGVASSTEIAYYAYSYAAIDPVYYKKMTSYVHCVVDFGRFCSYAMAQILISTDSLEYMQLNYIALGSSSLIFVIALFLPCISWRKSLDRIGIGDLEKKRILDVSGVNEGDRKSDGIGKNESKKIDGEKIDSKSIDLEKKSIENKSIDNQRSDKQKVKTYRGFVKFYFVNLWTTFKKIYSTKFMWKWSSWLALATCGMLQVVNYIQNLWITVQPTKSDVWNGVVEAACTLIASILVACLQFLTVRWEIWGEFTLAIISIIDCVLLTIMSQLWSLVAVYVLYTIFRVLYEVMFSIALYNIAKTLSSESYGLVFGFNMFVALVLQTILTIAVADEHGFALSIRNQFIVYGVYHGLISIVFLIIGVRTLIKHFCPTCDRSKPDHCLAKAVSEVILDAANEN